MKPVCADMRGSKDHLQESGLKREDENLIKVSDNASNKNSVEFFSHLADLLNATLTRSSDLSRSLRRTMNPGGIFSLFSGLKLCLILLRG